MKFEEYIDFHRKQRHDFMNNIQVIYGYLQIDHKDGAIDYIRRVSEDNENISKLYALGDPYFAFCIEEQLKVLQAEEVQVEFDIEIESFYYKNFEKEYNNKCNLISKILSELSKCEEQYVYIYIFEGQNGQSILICNNEDVVDELNWIEDWEEVQLDIDEFKLYKYAYDSEIGYKLSLCSR